MATTLLLTGFLALAVTVATAPPVLALLRRANVVDQVSERSSHDRPTPRGGGIAPAVGAVVAVAATPSIDGGARLALALGATAFGLVGLVEDLAGIRALRRLAIQGALALAAAAFLLDWPAVPELAKWGLAVAAAVWLVAYVNAFNFMDGVNGMSVAQAGAAGITWFLIGIAADSTVLAASGIIVTGSALGFAPFNLPRALMFLGDVGSYFLGAWLAVTVGLAVAAGLPPEAVIAPLVVYGADTATTLFRRIRRGEDCFSPHRDHTYQRLSDLQWSHVQISAFAGACMLACGALGAASLGSSVLARIVADVTIGAIAAAYLCLPRWLWRRRRAQVVLV